jgi:hypothetical protein
MTTQSSQRKIIPSSKLTADNAGDLELPSHRRAVASASAALTAPSTRPLSPCPLPESSPPPQDDGTDTGDMSSLAGDPPDPPRRLAKWSSHAMSSSASVESIIVLSPTMSDDARDPVPKPKRMKTFTASDPSDPGDGDGGPSMIEIDEDPRDERLNRSDLVLLWLKPLVFSDC